MKLKKLLKKLDKISCNSNNFNLNDSTKKKKVFKKN